MDKENHTELLLHLWLRLDDTKGLLSAIEKGLHAEVALKTSELHGIISILKRETEALLERIDGAV